MSKSVKKFVLFTALSTALFFASLYFLGLIQFETFSIEGQVLETIEPNIYYVYTYQGTNEYGQSIENYEIINKDYQTNGLSHMLTLGVYPKPGDIVKYSRFKVYIYWPRHVAICLNFVR